MSVVTDYQRRVWKGDLTTVAEMRERYAANAEKELLSYAAALYSFRHKREFARELVGLCSELIAAAHAWGTQPKRTPHDRIRCVQSADVLSTYLLWLSRHQDVLSDDAAIALRFSESLCRNGIVMAEHFPQELREHHSVCLLRLTLAQLLLEGARYNQSKSLLDVVRSKASLIQDPNQRSRVYRKLGMLYRHNRRYPQWFFYGVRACLVYRSTTAIKLKSVAALLGIER